VSLRRAADWWISSVSTRTIARVTHPMGLRLRSTQLQAPPLTPPEAPTRVLQRAATLTPQRTAAHVKADTFSRPRWLTSDAR